MYEIDEDGIRKLAQFGENLVGALLDAQNLSAENALLTIQHVSEGNTKAGVEASMKMAAASGSALTLEIVLQAHTQLVNELGIPMVLPNGEIRDFPKNEEEAQELWADLQEIKETSVDENPLDPTWKAPDTLPEDWTI